MTNLSMLSGRRIHPLYLLVLDAKFSLLPYGGISGFILAYNRPGRFLKEVQHRFTAWIETYENPRDTIHVGKSFGS